MDYNEVFTKAMEMNNTEVMMTAIESAAQVSASIAIAKGMMVLSMVGSALGEGYLVATAFKAIGRNPKLEDTLFSKVIIGVALVESTAIYAFVAFFLMGN